MTYTFGLDTFGDRESRADGTPLSHAQTIRNVVEEGVFAEQAGVDFFGIGEHHTDYFPMPAGDVALAAIAARTEKIRLGSAVTVLSSDDPVRVFQRYSTLDAVSGGRAEVILGRGSSIESFPLFGYDLADYEELFDEKATLFAELLKGGPVTWEGKTRAALLSQDVVPHLESGPFPAWIGVGGNPQSVIRAARLGFSLALAIIGGPPSRFAAYSELFRRALEKFGQPPRPVLVHSPGHVAATDEQAKAEFWPAWREVIALVAEERGFAIPTEASFDRGSRPGRGAVRRLAGDRGQQDRRERARPGRHQVRPEVRPAGPDPRSAHDHHRAVRPAGRPAGARTARLTPGQGIGWAAWGARGRAAAQRRPGSGAACRGRWRGCWPAAAAISVSVVTSHTSSMARPTPRRWYSRRRRRATRRLTAWIFSRTGMSSPEASRVNMASRATSAGSLSARPFLIESRASCSHALRLIASPLRCYAVA